MYTFYRGIIVILGVYVVALLIVFMLAIMDYLQSKQIEGDLNHDNQLTIVDLSILAERIRTQ